MPAVAAQAWPSATRVVVDGKVLLAFCGCNYLGFSHHPRLLDSVRQGLACFGIAANGSRETTGTTTAHLELEASLAALLGREAALLTPDGTLANVAACQGLAAGHELAWIAPGAHRSLNLAAQGSGLAVSNAQNAGPEPLQDAGGEALSRTAGAAPSLLLTDGIFATSGKHARLGELLATLPSDGALLLDDSHGLGVLGAHGEGSVGQQRIGDPRLVITSSLGKALGVYGGIVAGPKPLIERIRAESSAYRGATPIPPALAWAGSVALRVLAEERPQDALQANILRLRALFADLGLPLPPERTPIFSFAPPSALVAAGLRQAASEAGILLPLIDYPGGPAATYYRISVSAAHTEEDLQRLADVLGLGLAHR